MCKKPYKEELNPLFRNWIDIYLCKMYKPTKGKYMTYSYKYKDLYHSDEVIDYIDSHNKVYISSDYHITRPWRRRAGIPEKITEAHNKVVTNDDILIILGDLTDPEFPMKPDDFVSYFQRLKGDKILILGNNDTLPSRVYSEAGFKYVLPNLDYKGIILSHLPYDTDRLNIHGHIHNDSYYYDVEVRNHRNIFIDNNNYYPYTFEEALELPITGKTLWSLEHRKIEEEEY